jgi:hypothetical protein
MLNHPVLTAPAVSAETKNEKLLSSLISNFIVRRYVADKPGTDTFVFFAWDGELSSRFSTITITTGTGTHAPVATELTLDVWENSLARGAMPATDADGAADIYR